MERCKMQFFMAAVSSSLITWVTRRLEVGPRLVCVLVLVTLIRLSWSYLQYGGDGKT